MDIFKGEILPTNCDLVGYSWLLNELDLKLPLRKLSCISHKRLSSKREQKGIWTVFDAQIQLRPDISGHLEFCLKHETLDLLLIKKILQAWGEEELTKYIQTSPKSIYPRRLWFYFEYLFNHQLDLPDTEAAKYESLIDEKTYYTRIKPEKFKRHKIKNNLLGTREFCPIVRRTQILKQYTQKDLKNKAQKLIGKVSKEVIRRASSFLLLADSKASFEIEGERPASNRIERWGKIINEAGKKELSLSELDRLHAALIHDERFIKIGLREEGVFLGERDSEGNPIPEFIGAKEKDLYQLIKGWVNLNQSLAEQCEDSIIHATIIAFSFVYIHPFEDGNGRIHRYLLHHVLGKQGFYNSSITFPISSVILDNIEDYRKVLVDHTSPLMESIVWEKTDKQNIVVTNETSDLYRYFDITKTCEFLYGCVAKTVEEFLPKEIHYLEAFDQCVEQAKEIIEMPDHELKQLLTFIIHNEGKLSKRKKEKFFDKINPGEQQAIESIVRKLFIAY